MEILQIRDLSFRYPASDRRALDGVSLTVHEGEFAVICGESGCGKSTLLRLIKRELAPYGEQSGEIRYRGVPLSGLDERTAASEIGLVMQNPESQIVTDTVWHELAFGLESLGLDSPVIRLRVAETAGYFGMEDWFHKKTAELSGGQKQLVNLASVMVMQPKILLLDEPTAQLDPVSASNFIGMLQKLNRELGLTVVLVEHRLEEVYPIADRVVLMDGGKRVCEDSPKRIGAYFRDRPDHPVAAALPAAMRIFNLLKEDGESPVTVREGRDYLTRTFGNRVDSLEQSAPGHGEQKAVELKEVWFRYEKELPDVMRGVSLTVYSGEHFCLLGGNGTGKTTALSVIAGLMKPYRGQVLLNGKKLKDYTGNSLYRGGLALLPQNPQTVFLEKTVRDELRETCRTMKYTEEEGQRRIADMARRMGIEPLLDRHPYDLSGGEQQKAALAKILLLRPKLLLLDEPTKGMDAGFRASLSSVLSGLKEEGVTVLTVTHDVEFAAANADRCGLFFDGELVSVNTPTAFFSGNRFYTTAANRISSGFFRNTVLCGQVAELCRVNGKRR